MTSFVYAQYDNTVGEATQVLDPNSRQIAANAVTGLKSPPIPVVVLFGDSTFAYSSILSGTANGMVNNKDGTATVSFSFNPGVLVDDPIGIQGTINADFKVRESKVKAVSGNNITYYLDQGANPPSVDVSTAISIRYPLQASAAGPMTLLHNMTGRRLKFINSGQAGDTIAKMLARFDKDVAAYKPTRVLFTGGINDVFGPLQPLATMQANFLSVVDKCKSIGAKLDVITPFPQTKTDGTTTRGNWTTSTRDQFIAWRRWLIAYCAANGLSCYDWASMSAGTLQVQDPTSTDAVASAGAYNADLIHPKPNAVYALVKTIAADYAIHYPYVLFPQVPKNTTDGGLFSNPLFLGTGGTPVNGTGTVAAGPIATNVTVTVSVGTGTATPYQTPRTVAVDKDNAGNWQGVSFDAAAAGDTCLIKLQNLCSPQQLANFDVVKVIGLLRITSGYANAKELSAYVNSQTTTTGNLKVSDMAVATSQQSPYPEAITIPFGFEAPVRGPNSVHGNPSAFVPTIQLVAAGPGNIKFEVACCGADKI